MLNGVIIWQLKKELKFQCVMSIEKEEFSEPNSLHVNIDLRI